MHAVHLNVTANTMVVDDLGLVIGDLHKNPCVQGDGVTSTKGASGNIVHCFIFCKCQLSKSYNICKNKVQFCHVKFA